MAKIEVPGKPVVAEDRFQSASTESLHRIIGASVGAEGVGKTRTWLTGPEPVYVQLSDPAGLEGITSQFPKKDIRVIPYDFNPKDRRFKVNGKIDEKKVQAAAEETLEQFLQDYDAALRNARTLVRDKEDWVWELYRYARLGAATARPNEYADLYLEYRHMLYKAFGAGLNVGLIHGMKEKWLQKLDPSSGKMKGYPSGEMVWRGMKEVPELVQIVLHHRWNEEDGYHVVVEKCRQNGLLRGTKLNSDECNIPTIGQLVFDDSTEDDWL